MRSHRHPPICYKTSAQPIAICCRGFEFAGQVGSRWGCHLYGVGRGSRAKPSEGEDSLVCDLRSRSPERGIFLAAPSPNVPATGRQLGSGGAPELAEQSFSLRRVSTRPAQPALKFFFGGWSAVLRDCNPEVLVHELGEARISAADNLRNFARWNAELISFLHQNADLVLD